MLSEDTLARARALVTQATGAGVRLATAESCTGGLVAAALTAVTGSSAVVDRGFITYSNEAKAEMLGVDAALIDAQGAVSEAVARAMAEGALANSMADLVVSVTGIAGPGGGSEDKPIGMVHFGLARRGGAVEHRVERFGDVGRERVREAAVRVALDMLERGLRG